MGLTRVERQAQTRRHLLDAGAAVVAERGYHAASIEEIAARAGYTRGAFYSNFASKEELFAELLQERVYARYRRMAENQLEGGEHPSAREVGERLARVQAHPDGRWMFVLWLELLAQAGRAERFRALAVEFWRTNRAVIARVVEERFAARGQAPPVAPDRMASLLIALDVGLAIQHHVDPEAVPLDVYGDLFEHVGG